MKNPIKTITNSVFINTTIKAGRVTSSDWGRGYCSYHWQALNLRIKVYRFLVKLAVDHSKFRYK